jgi:hypothetical protein
MIEQILEGLDVRIQVRVSPSEKKELYSLVGNDSRKAARLLRWGFLQALALARESHLKETNEQPEQQAS